ncbi:unnamed protein product [Parajaminaea phylloscopi]
MASRMTGQQLSRPHCQALLRNLQTLPSMVTFRLVLCIIAAFASVTGVLGMPPLPLAYGSRSSNGPRLPKGLPPLTRDLDPPTTGDAPGSVAGAAVGDGCAFFSLPNCQQGGKNFFQELPIKSQTDKNMGSFKCTRNTNTCAYAGSYGDPCQKCTSVTANTCYPRGEGVCFVG